MATWLKVTLAPDRLTISGRRLWCGDVFSERLWLVCNLSKRLRRNLHWRRSWREPSENLCPTKSGLRLRSRTKTSPHNGSGTNAEYGAKQRTPRRPHEEYKDKCEHQKRFAKSRLSAAFVVDIEQQCQERSHFSTLSSSTPKPTPNRRSPAAATMPTAIQRRTADRE